jgi:hypothetical protein
MSDVVKVKDAEIGEDGCIMIEFNETLNPAFISKKAVFAPEVLIALAIKYGVIPPREETDYPGLPFVGGENVHLEDDEDEDVEDEFGAEGTEGTEEPKEGSNGPNREA